MDTFGLSASMTAHSTGGRKASMVVRLIIALSFWLSITASTAFAGAHAEGDNSKNPKYRPSEEALAALVSDNTVKVDEGEFIVFTPQDQTPSTGLILYPGGLCDPRGYAPLMREIAAASYLAVIVPMPNNLAIMGNEKANDVKSAFPDIEQWTISGHSLGGASAVMYLGKYPEGVNALIMFDSYTSDEESADELDIPILSLYANSHHNPERPELFENAKQFLPSSVEYQVVDGADHMQFGSFVKEDIVEQNTATISESEQRAKIIEGAVAFLEKVYAAE